jgi:hypothetical protein
MGPWGQASFSQAALTRKNYVPPESTAQGDDSEAFAVKMGSALGSGKSFHLKRVAFEVYDFT